MDYVTHRISLDIYNSSSQVLLRVKRNETSRRLHITLREGGQPYQIAEGCTAAFSAIKPDGNSLYNNCEIDGNTIIYTFTEQTTLSPGMMDCEIILKDGDDQKITSPRFSLLVEEGLFYGDEVMSSPEATMLDGLIERANTAAENAENVVENITKYVGDNFANAFKGSKSGAIVQADDVSPVEHNVKMRVHGKNMIPFPYPYVTTTVVREGVTFTIAEDGSIKIEGTASANASISLVSHNSKTPMEKGKRFVLSVTSSFTSDSGYVYLQNMIDADNIVDRMSINNGSNSFVASEDGFMNIGIVVIKGYTYDETVYVQLEEGETATEYEPYLDPTTVTVTEETTGTTYTPNKDGTCDVVSASPVMTISTDNEKAFVEIEYNRDSNKVAKALYDFIVQETSAPVKVSSVTLRANGWSGNASPYSQVVSIPGITENSMVDLTPSVEQLAVFHNKDLAFVTENVGGVVTVYAIGQKPTNDYTMPVAITEVKA